MDLVQTEEESCHTEEESCHKEEESCHNRARVCLCQALRCIIQTMTSMGPGLVTTLNRLSHKSWETETCDSPRVTQ